MEQQPLLLLRRQFLYEELYDTIMVSQHSYEGYYISYMTFLLTIFLDICSYQTIQKLWYQQRNGTTLYVSAILLNVLNHFFIGVPMYAIATKYFCKSTTPTTTTNTSIASSGVKNEANDANYDMYDNVSNNENLVQHVLSVVTILLIHSILYYSIHKYFHESPKLYKMIHQYHHQFKLHVPPMAANAVTPTEYIVAYAIPFAVACLVLLCTPTTVALRDAVIIASITNLLVHTPILQEVSMKYVPRYFVSTNDHLTHHAKITTNYASPTFNIDYILSKLLRTNNKRSVDTTSTTTTTTNGNSKGKDNAKKE